MPYRRTARSEAVRSASRAKLMKAAVALLAKNGYEATTMQDVVAAAGTSIGNAYFYFGSKEQLLREAIAAVIAELLAEAEAAALAFPPGPRRLAVLLATNVASVASNRDGIGSMLDATDQQLQTLQAVEEQAIEVLVRHLEPSFPERAAEAPRIAALIFGANRTFLRRRIWGKLDASPEEAIRILVGWSLRALGLAEAEIDDAIETGIAAARSSAPAAPRPPRARRART